MAQSQNAICTPGWTGPGCCSRLCNSLCLPFYLLWWSFGSHSTSPIWHTAKVNHAAGIIIRVKAAEMKSRNRRKHKKQDMHFLYEEGMVACNPRDREAAHRAEYDRIATEHLQEVTCKKCLVVIRKMGIQKRSASSPQWIDAERMGIMEAFSPWLV